MIMAVDLYDRFRHANDWAPERVTLVDFSSAQPHYSLSLHHPLIPLFPYFLYFLYFRHLSSDRLALQELCCITMHAILQLPTSMHCFHAYGKQRGPFCKVPTKRKTVSRESSQVVWAREIGALFD
jgi:hypothetical protein